MEHPLMYESFSAPRSQVQGHFGLALVDLGVDPQNNLSGLLSLYFLFCLPRFDENDLQNFKEKNIISSFRDLSKNITSIKRIFTEIQSHDEYQCQSQRSDIHYDSKGPKTFYLDPFATFTTKPMYFENKLIFMGAIFKTGIENQYLGECSIFLSIVVKDQYIKCLNSSIVQVEGFGLTFDVLQYWSFWAKIICTYVNCVPLCIKTNRNVCGFKGEECINGYSMVPVNVTYTTAKLKTQNKYLAMNLEQHCLYYNPCLKRNCGSQKCYTIENGTSRCASFSLSIFSEKSNSVLIDEYVEFGDTLTCVLRQQVEHGQEVVNLKPAIKWVTETYNRYIIAENNKLYIKLKNFRKKIQASCVAEFSKYSPPYEEKLEFILYKLPSKVYMDGGLPQYVQGKQRIYCKSDGYPKEKIKYIFNIHTKNFDLNKRSKYIDYLEIPQNAKLGLLRLSCEAKMMVGNRRTLSPNMTYSMTVTNVINLQWNQKSKILYINSTLSCEVETTFQKTILIFQVYGPSKLNVINNTHFNIDGSLKGGDYGVMCSVSVITNTLLRYHKMYTFHFFKRPNALCLYAKPGFKRIVIICLHNGFPQYKAKTRIMLKKVMRNQGDTFKNISSNKILIYFENEFYDYRFTCDSVYDNIALHLETHFRLQDEGGIYFRGENAFKDLCTTEIEENNLQEIDEFWLNVPVALNFVSIKICLIFIVMTNIMAFLFISIHIYSLDVYVAMSLTVSSLSRRHCIMRLYKKLNEVALFRVKNAVYADTSLLKQKFEAYKLSEDR